MVSGMIPYNSFAATGLDGALYMNFEEYDISRTPPGMSSASVQMHNGTKALEIKIDKYGVTNKLSKFILGEFCLSFDIASSCNDLNGSVGVMSGGNSTRQMVVFENGIISAGNKKRIGKVGTKFKRITVSVNPIKKTFAFYADGKCYLSKAYFDALSNKCMEIKFTFKSTEEDAKVYLDNICLHSTTTRVSQCPVYNPDGYVPEPRDIVLGPERKYDKTWGSDQAQVNSVASVNAIHYRSGLIHLKGEKSLLPAVPIHTNGTYLVPSVGIEKLLDTTVTVSDKTINVGNRATLTVGSTSMKTASGTAELTAAPVEQDGIVFLPLEDITRKAFGEAIVTDTTATNGGMAVIGDSVFTMPANESNLNKLNDYLFYYRPEPAEILNDYKNSAVSGQHPRLLINKDKIEKLKAEIQTSELHKSWYDRLIIRADALTKIEPLEYEFRDGVRLLHVASAYREYIDVLALAYLLTGDSKYGEAAWRQTEAICSFPDWNPAHHLDVGIMSVGLAVAYDWLYEYWTPERREIMEKAAHNNCFWVATESYRGTENDMQGTIHQNNHNTLVNTGILTLSLVMMDVYPEVCSWTSSQAIRCIEYMIENFAPIGSYIEGPAYASITIDYLSIYLAALESVLGKFYCLDLAEGLKEAANYLTYIQSDVSCFNFTEAEFGFSTSPGLFWFFEHYGLEGVKKPLTANKKYSANYDGVLVYSLLWYGEDEDVTVQNTLDKCYDDIDVVTVRNNYNDGQIFAGFKGGETIPATFNAHMDQGSFVYDAFGVRWAYDMGRDDYNLPGYMDVEDTRWKIFRLRSESHNTISINPSETANYKLHTRAKVVEFDSKPRGVKTVIDMSEVLQDHATSAKRGFLFADERTSFVVRDEVVLPGKSDIYWFMYTKANCEIDGDTVLLTDTADSGKQVLLELTTSGNGELYVEDAAPLASAPVVVGQVQNKEYKRIVYKVSAKGNASITAKLTPVAYLTTSVKDFDMPIDTWQIPDGEIEPMPTLDKLVIDGVEYDVNNRIITVSAESDTSPVPQIEAVSSKYGVEIEKGETVADKVMIHLTKPENPKIKYSYTISFDPKRVSRKFEGYTEAKVASVRATDEPEAENIAENVLDGKPGTRWSAEKEQSLFLELEQESEIDTYIMSMYLGNTRFNAFEVYVSVDGKDYKLAYAGRTSGETELHEYYDLGKQRAKYIRVDFHGASNATWNSVTEAAVAKKQ